MGKGFEMLDYEFVLKCLSPILIHGDDVMASDELTAWRKDPKNKSVSVPGDDRSPAWTWMTYLYHDGERLAMPQDNIMCALRHAGAKVSAKGKSTFKSMSQSGLLIGSDFCEFTNAGEPILIADILAFRDAKFSDHIKECRNLGFDLLVKRASVGSSKHVRVRPRFDEWQVRGSITVSEPAITQDVLEQLFELAGRYAGLCDWRPSSPKKPGPYGMFTAEVKPVKAARRAG
jgi:hypothetical protein